VAKKRKSAPKPKDITGMSNDEVARAVRVLDRSKYIGSLYQVYGQDLVAIHDQQRTLHDNLVGRGIWCQFDDIEAELLYLFIREMGCGQALEIGSGPGWATTWMLQALRSMEGGTLLSFNKGCNTPDFVPPGLVTDRWNFARQDIREWSSESLKQLDFLLVDTDHQPDLVGWIIEHIFPLVRSGGKIAVHDVFNLATPAHGEAAQVFRYLEKIGVRPYTASHCFPKIHAAINRARKAVGIDVDKPIHPWPNNPLLIFDAP
jgi:hypothetical protein